MNESSDVELVRRFVEGVSEVAFTQVVQRYGGLVCSTAMRITSSPEAARDVTQIVFVDLLKKASRVRELARKEPVNAGPAVLAGWLHRAARFEALEFVRSETRRTMRERLAMEDQFATARCDEQLETLKPMMDEALDALEEMDRRAILLRFFQGADFRKVGAALGVSDDAAQKRVSRAIERLRARFAAKGVITTAAALGTSLASDATEALDAEFIRSVALEAWRSGGAIASDSAAAGALEASRLPARWGVIGAALVALVSVFWLLVSHFAGVSSSHGQSNVDGIAVAADTGQNRLSTDARLEGVAGQAAGARNEAYQLILKVLDEATGQGIASVQVSPTYIGESTQAPWPLRTDSNGAVTVEFPDDISTLRISLMQEGFPDKQLLWSPKRGQKIPAEYTVKMRPGVMIGGFVLDEEDKPIGDVLMQLHLPDAPTDGIAEVESFVAESVHLKTDANGFWQTARVAEELIPRIEGTPWQPGFRSHPWFRFGTNEGAIDKLLARNFVFHLDRGLQVRGVVTDANGQPAARAYVTIGDYYSNQASAMTGASGEFVVSGCVAGRHVLTVKDEKRGVGFQVIDVSTNTEAVSIRLEPYRVLRLLVIDPDGRPIPRVSVRWENYGVNGTTVNDAKGETTPQLNFERETGPDGMLVWDHAPVENVTLSFYAKRHTQRHNVRVKADGTLQTISLEEMMPPQIVRGTVRDALTGEVVSPLRVQYGYPRKKADGSLEPVWYRSAMQITDFEGGEFKLTFENSANENPASFERIFGVLADGYEEGVSRVVKGDEGGVVLEFWLKPKRNGERAGR